MGYTHYFEIEDPFPERIRKQIYINVYNILKEYSSILDITEISEYLIDFNGIDEEACENLYIELDKPEHFAFCKTNRYPYDKIVTATLLTIKYINDYYYRENILLSSDGNIEEWKDGFNIAKVVLSNYENHNYIYKLDKPKNNIKMMREQESVLEELEEIEVI